MSVLISDNLQVKDCKECRSSQAQFDGLCARCHFVREHNEKLAQIRAEKDEYVIRFWGKVLAWAFVAVICGALIFLTSLWK